MIFSFIIFGTLALVVIATAIGMLISRNAVYSALFLVLNFATVAMLYLLLGAPFITMLQITVYAGAIMVLFLFVIMMLGSERLFEKEPFRGERILAVILGGIFLVESILVVIWQGGNATLMQIPPADFASPVVIGKTLYTTYALPFLITGIILLAAVIGAIALPHSYFDKAQRRLRKGK